MVRIQIATLRISSRHFRTQRFIVYSRFQIDRFLPWWSPTIMPFILFFVSLLSLFNFSRCFSFFVFPCRVHHIFSPTKIKMAVEMIRTQSQSGPYKFYFVLCLQKVDLYLIYRIKQKNFDFTISIALFGPCQIYSQNQPKWLNWLLRPIL